MNISGYRQNKGEHIEIKPAGNGIIHLYVAKYDQTNGQRMPDEFGQTNLATLEVDRQTAEANVEAAKEYLADLDAFIKDAEKADADFNKSAKKPGKQS